VIEPMAYRSRPLTVQKALVGYCSCRRTETSTSEITEPVFGRV
jgi:hypothetical protein